MPCHRKTRFLCDSGLFQPPMASVYTSSRPGRAACTSAAHSTRRASCGSAMRTWSPHENTRCRTGSSLLGGGLPLLAGRDGLLQRLQQDSVHGQPIRLLRELLRLRERRLPRPSAGCLLRICRQRLRLRGPRRRRVKRQSSSKPRRAYSAAGRSPANERQLVWESTAAIIAKQFVRQVCAGRWR